MKRTALKRTKPLRRVGTSAKKKSNTPTLDKTRGYPRLRRWTCAHCRMLNGGDKKKCQRCAIRRATKRKSLSARCDSMWAQIVKAGGRCEAGMRGQFEVAMVLCSGELEAAHVVPRRHRSTRWDISNGRALCHTHHYFFTNSEKAWRDWIGPEWDRLWIKAQERWDRSFPIADLSAQLRTAREAA